MSYTQTCVHLFLISSVGLSTERGVELDAERHSVDP